MISTHTIFRALAIATLGFALAGCSILSSSGPNMAEVEARAVSHTRADYSTHYPLEFALIDLTPQVVAALPGPEPRTFAGRFVDRRPAPPNTLGIGDIITIVIFEASAGGLFIPAEAGARSGNFISLPQQEVDRDGNISVPYAGVVRAAGRTIRQVQQAIQDALRQRAIEPQVVVTINERRSGQVTILGDVGAQRLNLNPLGERIVDVIARAGGTRFPGHETLVTLLRGGQRATVSFSRLITSPADNIYVQPGDTIYVLREAQAFLVFGGTGTQGLVPFDKENITLSEAVAKAGGLRDERADADSVLLYRVEHRAHVERMGVDLSRLPRTDRIPVVYRARIREPTGYFVTSSFQMRDRDIIYVANAASVDWQKFTSFINNTVNFAFNVASVPTIGQSTTTNTVLRTTGTVLSPTQ